MRQVGKTLSRSAAASRTTFSRHKLNIRSLTVLQATSYGLLQSHHFSTEIKKNLTLKDFSTGDLVEKLKHANIAELIVDACVLFADKPSFGTRVGNKYEWMSYRELGVQIQKLRNVLHHHNIKKNDKVSIISNNRVEWAVAMYAVATVGAQLVPM